MGEQLRSLNGYRLLQNGLCCHRIAFCGGLAGFLDQPRLLRLAGLLLRFLLGLAALALLLRGELLPFEFQPLRLILNRPQ